jgi:hypothetical protein
VASDPEVPGETSNSHPDAKDFNKKLAYLIQMSLRAVVLSHRGLVMGHIRKARRIFPNVAESKFQVQHTLMPTGTTRFIRWGEGRVCG